MSSIRAQAPGSLYRHFQGGVSQTLEGMCGLRRGVTRWVAERSSEKDRTAAFEGELAGR